MSFTISKIVSFRWTSSQKKEGEGVGGRRVGPEHKSQHWSVLGEENPFHNGPQYYSPHSGEI